MAVDAISLAPKLDVIILVTGDGDFVPLVQFLRLNMGIRVEAVSFGKSTSGKLREAVDDFVDLCEEPEKYLIERRPIHSQMKKKLPGQNFAKKAGK